MYIEIQIFLVKANGVFMRLQLNMIQSFYGCCYYIIKNIEIKGVSNI